MTPRLSAAGRVKKAIYYARLKQLARRDWRRRFANIYSVDPEYAKTRPKEAEQRHVTRWRGLGKVHLDTYRVCANLSGRDHSDYVPEEIYATAVERSLNRFPEVYYLAHKSAYDRWYGKGLFPETFIHNIDGAVYDGEYNRIRGEELTECIKHLDYPLVIKPNRASYGGHDVFFPADAGELRELMEGRINYVVQRKIDQHEFFSKFNRHGLNTLRVCVYRSVKTNDLHVLNVSLRMGKGGSLDNETAGGIVCSVDSKGVFNNYALDKYGKRFESHPDTGIRFEDTEPVPAMHELRRVSMEIAEHVYLARILSLDMCMDSDGNWKAVEINIFGQTIRFAQYAGHPFFGDFTEEVIAYCLDNPWWRSP